MNSYILFTYFRLCFVQDLLMNWTLDTIIKVAFGFDLDTLSGSHEASNRFIKAFNDSNDLIYCRYFDILWRVKRYLNIGSEASLKENIIIIDNFLYELIQKKREHIKNGNPFVRKSDNSFLSLDPIST